MDAFAFLAIPLLMAVGANEATLAHQRQVAAAQYGAPYAYAEPPGSGWVPGAVLGGTIGALASGQGAGVLAGGLIGGAIGHAATMPPAYAYPPRAYAPLAYPPVSYAPPAVSPAYERPLPKGGADSFIAGWQGFMQPSQ